MVLQAYRNGSGQWMCDASNVPSNCPNPAAVQWARCAPGNSDGSETVPVMACATHQLTEDQMSMIHQATCTAPDVSVSTGLPTCTCTPFIPVTPAAVRAGA